MLRLLVCALLLTVGLAYVDDSIISKINSNPASTWTAGVNYVFLDKKLEQVARLCGTILRERVSNPISADTNDVENAVPASFDSRQAWPKCPSLSEIRNQAECGSCWAFGAVETLTDRYCIASNQTTNPRLSTLNLVACDENDNGCQGGDLESAWDYLQNSGIPTEDCQPYTIPTCPPDQQPCLNFVDTPDCPSACNGNQTGPITKLYYAKNGYSVGGWSGSAAAMQKEIMTNGPIEAAFTVYADFVHYKSGVYSHQTGSALGGHAVKIIGWGVDSTSNTPYWLVANSWTTSWGDEGYFKIKRGNDECGIESQAYVGLAKFP